MAGIGFELRRMIDERKGFVNRVRAYACAGLISSGPWLMTILTLTLLNLAGPALGGKYGYSLFRALVTYSFAFSLVLQGIVQMAVTRRIADLLYGHQYNRVLPAFAAMLLVVGVTHAAIAVLFSWGAGFGPTMTALTSSLFAIIGMTWMALIWLSIVRQYDDVLRAYIWGTLISLLGIPLLFLGQGTTGILAAYTGGQAYTLILLVRTIVRGMETGGGRDFSVVKAVGTFPMLVGVGVLYNAAIWVDKMIFWFSDGKNPHPLVHYHPLYDTCSFLAYLTVVPALAVNLIRLETSFYEKYRAYYGSILGGTPLAVIEDKKERMFQNLRESVVRLLRVQGAISILVILFAPLIIDFLELPEIAVRIFRLTCLGAYFHVLLLITILMQMYFDLRKQAFATSLMFCILNAGLAWWSVERGVSTYGIGYAMASFLSLLLGYMLLHGSLDRLDYLTFTNQPIGDEVEGAGAETTAEAEEKDDAEEDGDAFDEADVETESEIDEETEDEEEEEEEEFDDMPTETVVETDTRVQLTETEFDVADDPATATAVEFEAVAAEIVGDDDTATAPEPFATATEVGGMFEEVAEEAALEERRDEPRYTIFPDPLGFQDEEPLFVAPEPDSEADPEPEPEEVQPTVAVPAMPPEDLFPDPFQLNDHDLFLQPDESETGEEEDEAEVEETQVDFDDLTKADG